MNNKNTQKCYNSFSCIASVLIIIFVLGSIIWDICVSKPALRSDIEDIQVEIKSLHQKIDERMYADTIQFKDAVQLKKDSISVQK